MMNHQCPHIIYKLIGTIIRTFSLTYFQLEFLKNWMNVIIPHYLQPNFNLCNEIISNIPMDIGTIDWVIWLDLCKFDYLLQLKIIIYKINHMSFTLVQNIVKTPNLNGIIIYKNFSQSCVTNSNDWIHKVD